MAIYSPTRIARFWSKVDVRAGDFECWPWKATVGSNGYGRFSVSGGQSAHAHRVAWEIFHGERLGARFACHTCDNKLCVNPHHIYAGDRSTNARDATERGLLKGRPQAGELNGNAKLSAEQVAVIRQRLNAGADNTSLAIEYGVSSSMISRIRHGLSWTSVVQSDQQEDRISTPLTHALEGATRS